MNKRDLLELHGGDRYNLNSILHLDEDIDEETEAYINFKVSEYYDVDTIKSYSIGNKNSINIMSINAQSLFSKINIYINNTFSILTKIPQFYYSYGLCSRMSL